MERSRDSLTTPAFTHVSSLIRSSKGSYYAQYYRADCTPQRKAVPLKTKDRRTAERARLVVDELVTIGKLDPWVSTDYLGVLNPVVREWTLREALDDFYDAKTRAGRSARTLDTYRQQLEQFASYLALHAPKVEKVTDVTPEVISRWIDSTDTNTISRHKMRRHLSVFLNWMRDHHGVKTQEGDAFENPARKVELAKLPRKHPKYLTFPEVEKVLKAVHDSQENPRVTSDVTWIVPVVRCNVELGLRAGEVCDLRWSNVDFDDRKVRIFTTKGASDRTIPMSEYVAVTLLRIRAERARHMGTTPERVPRTDYVFKTSHDAGRLCFRHLSRRFKKFVRLALPPDRAEEVSFHGTRHSAASYLAQAGKSAEFIRDYMGHSSIQVTQKYMHLDRDKSHREAVEVFNNLVSEAGGSRTEESTVDLSTPHQRE